MDEVALIRERVDIVDLISEYVQLKKAGRNFKAPCPFHNEKSPSFVVSPERQIWHCFGCGKGGDCYTFLIEYERLEFPEALRMLAKKVGIELQQRNAQPGLSSQKERLYQANSLTKEFYHYVLTQHRVGEKARSYLKNRGITEAVMKTFMLGFSPSTGTALTQYLVKRKGFSYEEVIDAGLAYSRGSRTQDFFWGRLMFPLIDHRDNVVGFSGRILDNNDKTSKYINTRETLIYHKGEHFYGLSVTKDAIRRSNQAIIVEGEFDVISCFENGIANVVGVKGTALTEHQVNLLARYAQKITFCFDGDKAGQEAIKRSLPIVEKKNITPTVIEIPGGKDPDEALKNESGVFKRAVKEDIGIYDFLFKKVFASIDSDSAEGKKEIADTLLPFLIAIRNEIIKEHFLRKLSTELGTSYESIVKELNRLKRREVPLAVKPEEPKEKKSKEQTLEEYLFALIIQHQQPIITAQKTVQSLLPVFTQERAYQKLLMHLESAPLDGTFSTKGFGNSLPKELVPSYDTSLLMPLPPFPDEKHYDEEIKNITKKLRVLYIQRKLKELAREIQLKEEAGNDELVIALKKEYSTFASQIESSI